jgi:very-short-patch-repair endonuclease
VWRLVDWPRTEHQDLMIATLASGGTASHRAAAWLHRLDGFERFLAEVTIGPNQRYGGCVAHRAAPIERVDRTVVNGIPCTTATRTVIDLAGVVDNEALESALESAVRRNLTTPAYVRRRLDAIGIKGRSGARVLSDLLACHLGVNDSDLETRFLQLCRRARLPRPALHVEVGDYEVDYAYPEWRLAIELDGGVHKASTVFQRDRTKQNFLVLQGWTVLRFTWHDVTLRPNEVASAVLTALAA